MVQTFPVERFMDEADGKPGHVALQSGHSNALGGAPTVRLSLLYLSHSVILSERRESKDPLFRLLHQLNAPRFFLARTSRRQQIPPEVEQHHENVPGK